MKTNAKPKKVVINLSITARIITLKKREIVLKKFFLLPYWRYPRPGANKETRKVLSRIVISQSLIAAISDNVEALAMAGDFITVSPN